MTNTLQEKYLLYKVMTNKDVEAYASLYDMYVVRIYRFVYFKINNKEDAEDITSEVFLKAWNYLITGNQKKIDSLSGLLYSIARNAVIDAYRERARHPLFSIEYLLAEKESHTSPVIDDLQAKGEVEILYKAIQKMKQEYREIILLRYIEQLSLKEISDMLGKSMVGVRVLLHRAVKKLKELTDENEKGTL